MQSLALALAGLLAACSPSPLAPAGDGHPLEATVWDMAAGAPITPEALAARLAEADVAILGEVHDNAVHHARQAWLVERLAPAGIAFEMVPEASEQGIAVFLEEGGAPGEIGPAIGWARLGWPDWEMYRPVFEAAAGAYVAGGGISRGAIGQAAREGAKRAFGTGGAAYGLGEPLPPEMQAEAEAEMVASHCNALPAAAAAPMVEVQRLRDARFAHATRRAAAAGGGRVVLITGNGHARIDRGVPLALGLSDAALEVLSLGQVEVSEGRRALADYPQDALPYDFVWFSARAEREDPCAAFR